MDPQDSQGATVAGDGHEGWEYVHDREHVWQGWACMVVGGASQGACVARGVCGRGNV